MRPVGREGLGGEGQRPGPKSRRTDRRGAKTSWSPAAGAGQGGGSVTTAGAQGRQPVGRAGLAGRPIPLFDQLVSGLGGGRSAGRRGRGQDKASQPVGRPAKTVDLVVVVSQSRGGRTGNDRSTSWVAKKGRRPRLAVRSQKTALDLGTSWFSRTGTQWSTGRDGSGSFTASWSPPRGRGGPTLRPRGRGATAGSLVPTGRPERKADTPPAPTFTPPVAQRWVIKLALLLTCFLWSSVNQFDRRIKPVQIGRPSSSRPVGHLPTAACGAQTRCPGAGRPSFWASWSKIWRPVRSGVGWRRRRRGLGRFARPAARRPGHRRQRPSPSPRRM